MLVAEGLLMSVTFCCNWPSGIFLYQWPSGWTLPRVVRILLECIIVYWTLQLMREIQKVKMTHYQFETCSSLSGNKKFRMNSKHQLTFFSAVDIEGEAVKLLRAGSSPSPYNVTPFGSSSCLNVNSLPPPPAFQSTPVPESTAVHPTYPNTRT